MHAKPTLRSIVLAAAAACTASAVLVACGGGGSAEPANGAISGSTAPSAYGQGPIDGFGSIVVGGIRYDESSATIADENGQSLSSAQLKLGMMVQVQATSLDSAASAGRAGLVRVGNEVVGPVSSVNAAANSFVVLGQTVVVNSATLFDSSLSAGFSAIAAGAVVEVHGVVDAATRVIAATRIEGASAASAFQLRGAVESLDTTAKTFRIAGQLLSYAGLTSVPTGLANGVLVRVRLNTTQAAGAWVVSRLVLAQRSAEGGSADGTVGHVEGAITAFRTVSDFDIGGVRVDARNASFNDRGLTIGLGTRVQARGSFTGGVLVASTVKVEVAEEQPRQASAAASGGGSGSDRPSATSVRVLELHGPITSVNATAKTFVLRGITVSYAGTVVYKDGTVANLVANANVSVKGVLAADRQSLVASKIEFN